MEYLYSATVISVHDGDTLHLAVDLKRRTRAKDQDLGFGLYVRSGKFVTITRFRLYGIDAPELSTPEGVAAYQYFDHLLKRGTDNYVPLEVETIKQADHQKQEKYGRYLANLWYEGVSLNQEMVTSGHAVSFL